MISTTNTGTLSGVTTTDIRENLRLPEDYDDTLIQILLDAAVNHVEQATGQCIISKDVTQVWLRPERVYYLKYPADYIMSVTINDNECADIKAVTGVMPSCVVINSNINMSERNIITIQYTSLGTITPSLRNLVIMIASIYYNNPEGLGAIDQGRINSIINQNITMI